MFRAIHRPLLLALALALLGGCAARVSTAPPGTGAPTSAPRAAAPVSGAPVGGPEATGSPAGLEDVDPPCAPPVAIGSTPVYTYTIVNTYPHSPASFTQGLVYTDGLLYESTGAYNRSASRVLKIELETGRALLTHTLPLTYFGEGLTAFDDRLYQLTWQAQTGFVYSRDRFAQLGTFSYATQGWGLAQNGSQLIMSDGSAQLYAADPKTLRFQPWLTVTDGGRQIQNLNELEVIGGQIYANVWKSNYIARIDPRSGLVASWIDLCGLRRLARSGEPPDVNAVLNGIAYDPSRQRLFVTGKLWTKLFEIRLVCWQNCP